MKYTAPVRRGFGYMHDLLALSLSANPSIPAHSPSLSFVRSLTPLQRKDLESAINYTASEYNSELAKLGLSPPPRNPSLIAPSSPTPPPSTPDPTPDQIAAAPADADGAYPDAT